MWTGGFLRLCRAYAHKSAHINRKTDENFGSLEQTLGQLTADVNKLKQYVGKDREDIQLMQEDDDEFWSDQNDWNKNSTQ